MDEASVVRQAGLLVAQHGRDADIVAMTQAELAFAHGEHAAAARWLSIFRRIALTAIYCTRGCAD